MPLQLKRLATREIDAASWARVDLVAQLASIFNLAKWSCFAVTVPATVIGLLALAVVTLRGQRPAST